MSHAEGNTSLRARRWCLTIFKDGVDLSQIIPIFEEKKWHYIVGEETCPKTGNTHFQIYIESQGQIRFCTLKKLFPTAHCEIAKSGREDNIKYCSKDGKFNTNFSISLRRPLCEIEVLRPWQERIIDIINTMPHPRHIYWFWEPTGDFGKSEFSKYLAVNRTDTVVARCSGWKDMLTVVKDIYNCYIFDFGRNTNLDIAIALEQIKDGFVSDAKLKKNCETTLFPRPHVICFANNPPDFLDEISKDKLIIIKIDEW